MTRTKWWLRVVGVFYLLLTLLNLYALFVDTSLLESTLPYAAAGDTIDAFADAWLVFIAELGVLGAMLLYASRDPLRNRILVWTVVWAELIRGIVCDVIWISRDYSFSSYAVFILIHIVIIATGIYFIRQESRTAKQPLPAAAA